MKVKFFGLLILVVIVLNISSCDNYYDDFVSHLNTYQNSIKLDDKKFIIDTSSFDIKTYFSFFDRLNFDSSFNYFIEYYYMGSGGYPLYFAIPKQSNLKIFKIDNPSFYLIADSLPSKKDWDSISRLTYKYSIENMLNDSTSQYPTTKIKDLSDKKGYFQLLIFHLYKENFCRYDHSGYGSIDLIFSKKNINNILSNKYLNHYKSFSNSQINMASKINYKPEIKFSNGYCYITIVSFNDWKGFQKLYFRISQSYPNRVEYIKSEVLVNYNIGIMF
jgi:hypothetical protein